MRETFISLFENTILTEYKEYWKKRIYHIFSIFAFLPVWKFLQSKIHILRHSIWNVPAKMDFIKSSSESNNKLSLSKCSDAIMELLSRISLFHYPWSNSQSTKRTFFYKYFNFFRFAILHYPFHEYQKLRKNKQTNIMKIKKQRKKKAREYLNSSCWYIMRLAIYKEIYNETFWLFIIAYS